MVLAQQLTQARRENERLARELLREAARADRLAAQMRRPTMPPAPPCPAWAPALPPDPATATAAQLSAHAEHRRQLEALGSLPDPDFQPYPAAPPR